ncbi:SH3 domain-containing protein [Clostridium sp. P21]|uniref:SH3 domain-containing protein n=1 Tax=Clostridium muellerianum TaxID=2716538 RepID=A0A7Y0EEC1_9CLOT|nr:C40 family peptidase [Clostridium muellerianum]NMM61821.1 SH3 domain-containing protein [Clostridium muellerianum]
MDWYNNYRLVKNDGGYTVVINLNPNSTEFSKELVTNFKENILELDDQIRKLVEEKFSDVKVNSIKLMIGTVMIASVPFMMHTKVQAADGTSTIPTSQSGSITTLNGIGIVTASKLNVRSGSASTYSIIFTLWQGNKVTVIGKSGDWYQIKSSDGRIGWVSSLYLKVDISEQTSVQLNDISKIDAAGVVTASKLNVRSGPASTYSIILALWQGSKVNIIGKSGDWYQIKLSYGKIGWVNSAYLQVAVRQEKINIVISTAKSLLGTPYVWGGESLQEGGFDCSGFVYYTFKKAGYDLNRISSDQAKQGTEVSKENLQPGDLVFFSFEGNGVVNHVGIYIGNGQMIHSPKTGDVVKITDINTSYWQSCFVIAKRII